MNRTQLSIFIVIVTIAFTLSVFATTWALSALDIGTPVEASTIPQTIDVKQLQPTIDGKTLQGGDV